MSGASERVNGQASGPVLTSLFLFVPDHSAPVEYPALKLGFIGAGNMATAMAKGFLKAGLVTSDHVMASARTEATLKKFQDEVDAGVVVTKDNVAVAKGAGKVMRVSLLK